MEKGLPTLVFWNSKEWSNDLYKYFKAIIFTLFLKILVFLEYWGNIPILPHEYDIVIYTGLPHGCFSDVQLLTSLESSKWQECLFHANEMTGGWKLLESIMMGLTIKIKAWLLCFGTFSSPHPGEKRAVNRWVNH